MEELIDILNKDGSFTGKSISKTTVHKMGHYHNTAHLWLYTSDLKILLQQRSLSKLICPGLWDVSVAGHVDAGETIVDAILRETQEELGLRLSADDLTPIGVFKSFRNYQNGIIDNEFHNTFIAELHQPISSFDYALDEVEDIKLVTMNEFKTLLDNSTKNNHFIESNKDYYLNVLHEIRKILA